jgi:hypothetical protein
VENAQNDGSKNKISIVECLGEEITAQNTDLDQSQRVIAPRPKITFGHVNLFGRVLEDIPTPLNDLRGRGTSELGSRNRRCNRITVDANTAKLKESCCE